MTLIKIYTYYYQFQTYADEGYELEGVRPHLFKTMESYIDERFELYDDDDRKLNGFFGFKK